MAEITIGAHLVHLECYHEYCFYYGQLFDKFGYFYVEQDCEPEQFLSSMQGPFNTAHALLEEVDDERGPVVQAFNNVIKKGQ